MTAFRMLPPNAVGFTGLYSDTPVNSYLSISDQARLPPAPRAARFLAPNRLIMNGRRIVLSRLFFNSTRMRRGAALFGCDCRSGPAINRSPFRTRSSIQEDGAQERNAQIGSDSVDFVEVRPAHLGLGNTVSYRTLCRRCKWPVSFFTRRPLTIYALGESALEFEPMPFYQESPLPKRQARKQ